MYMGPFYKGLELTELKSLYDVHRSLVVHGDADVDWKHPVADRRLEKGAKASNVPIAILGLDTAQNAGLYRTVGCEELVVPDRIGSRSIRKVVGMVVTAIPVFENHRVVIWVLRLDERFRYDACNGYGSLLAEVVSEVHKICSILIHGWFLDAMFCGMLDRPVPIHDVVRTVDDV